MSEKCIRLTLSDHLVNCFGIQPTFYESEICNRISLFSLYRYTKWAGDDAKTNNIYYDPIIYRDKNAQIFYEMAIPFKHLEKNIIKILWENSSHIQLNATLDSLINDSNKLHDTLLYYSELLKYWNRLNRGNFFITSNKTIFDNIKFSFKQLQKFDKYFISEKLLNPDKIIIGAKGITAFDNPVIASPFLDKNDYKQFLSENKLTDFYQLKVDKRFPIMEKMNHLYDNYQLYLNEKVPQKWHLEIFKNCKLYYIVLHLR